MGNNSFASPEDRRLSLQAGVDEAAETEQCFISATFFSAISSKPGGMKLGKRISEDAPLENQTTRLVREQM